MRLRQIALVAENLAAAEAELTALLGVHVCYVDPAVGKFGLENILMPLGETLLEVVSPKEQGTTAERLLDKRGGDGGYMTIFQVRDFAEARERIEAADARIVAERHGENYDFAHIHPKDIGGAIVSVDEMRPWDHWEWAGPKWRDFIDTSVTTGIVGAEIQSDDPAATAARWADVLGLAINVRGDEIMLPLEGGAVRFVETEDGRGDGLGGFDVAVPDSDVFLERARGLGMVRNGVAMACGVRINPV